MKTDFEYDDKSIINNCTDSQLVLVNCEDSIIDEDDFIFDTSSLLNNDFTTFYNQYNIKNDNTNTNDINEYMMKIFSKFELTDI